MSKNLTAGAKRWLVATHILSSVMWLGAAICILTIDLLVALPGTRPGTEATSYAAMTTLDTTVLRVGALGSLITGLALAVLTAYGVLRYRWIIFKEVVTVLVIVLGSTVVHGLHQQVGQLLADRGATDQAYLASAPSLAVAVSLQVIALTSALVVSSVKPWGVRRGRSRS